MTAQSPIRISRAKLAILRADPHVTTDEIAAALGIHRSSVASFARRLDLPPVKCGPKPIIPREPFATLWLAGISARVIAERIGVSRNYTTTLAKRFGLPPRRQGARPTATLQDLASEALARRMKEAAAVTRQAMRDAEMLDAISGRPRARAAG
jgi:transposase